MSDFELSNKVIIVTGAAGGIGSVMAREFAGAGATVVLAGRTEDSLNAVAADLGDARTLVVGTDVTDPSSVQNLIDTTVSEFGRVDVIVNNVGAGAMPCEPEDTPYDVWSRLIDVNLTSVFNCCIAAGKQMIKQKSGKIINISSTAGTKGNPGMVHYSAAKAGVLSLTNNLAYSWAKHNICVNAVVPGLIATPAMIKYGVTPAAVTEDGEAVPRLALAPGPEDVARTCQCLASDAADMITGEAIPVRAWNPMDRFWT
ncbi:MAG: SDR family oxidoreductase [Pseudomonadota bacterium]